MNVWWVKPISVERGDRRLRKESYWTSLRLPRSEDRFYSFVWTVGWLLGILVDLIQLQVTWHCEGVNERSLTSVNSPFCLDVKLSRGERFEVYSRVCRGLRFLVTFFDCFRRGCVVVWDDWDLSPCEPKYIPSTFSGPKTVERPTTRSLVLLHLK